MLKEDYLIRLITELGRKIAAMLDKRTHNHPDDSLVLARVLFKEIVGQDINDEPFTIDRRQMAQWSPAQTEMMAEAAYETGKAYHDLHDTRKAAEFMAIAVQLYEVAESKDHTWSEQREQRKQSIQKEQQSIK